MPNQAKIPVGLTLSAELVQMLDEAASLLDSPSAKTGRATAAAQVLEECLAVWLAIKRQSKERDAQLLRDTLASLGKPSAGSQTTVVQSPPTRQKRGR